MTWYCDSGNYSSSPMKDLCSVCRNCCVVCMVRPRDARNHFMNLTCVCVCMYICVCMYVCVCVCVCVYIYQGHFLHF